MDVLELRFDHEDAADFYLLLCEYSFDGKRADYVANFESCTPDHAVFYYTVCDEGEEVRYLLKCDLKTAFLIGCHWSFAPDNSIEKVFVTG